MITILTAFWWMLFAQYVPFPRPSAPTGVSRTIVQGCSYQGSLGVSTGACVFGSSITAGNTVYVCASYSFSGSGASFSGQTFTPDPGSGTAITGVSWASSNHVSCAYVLSATSGTTVSVSVSGGGGSTVVGMIGVELNGPSTLTENASENGSGSVFGTSATSFSITPTSGAIALDVCLSGSGSVSVGSGWTYYTGSGYSIVGYQIASGSSLNGTCTTSPAANLWAHTIAFY